MFAGSDETSSTAGKFTHEVTLAPPLFQIELSLWILLAVFEVFASLGGKKEQSFVAALMIID